MVGKCYAVEIIRRAIFGYKYLYFKVVSQNNDILTIKGYKIFYDKDVSFFSNDALNLKDFLKGCKDAQHDISELEIKKEVFEAGVKEIFAIYKEELC